MKRLTPSLLCIVLAACGGSGGNSGDAGQPPADASGVNPDAATPSYYVRVHYRLQGGGDAKAWGIHFWNAGSTSPVWGMPQPFANSDAFGVYSDIKVTDVADNNGDAWLGLIPVQCNAGNCTKDVQTAVRFIDLTRNAANPNIAECWITQGQAVQIKPPASTGPAYKIFRPSDFIDLGDGRVRLMFRVPPGSTGTVSYGTDTNKLSSSVSWAAKDDVNTNGLIISGLTPSVQIYYQINSTLASSTGNLTDTSAVQSLTPLPFATIAQTSDWAAWGQKGVMYELMVRTFADGGTPKAAASITDPGTQSGIDTTTRDGVGDLVGLRNALPYLKDLGIDAIWMMPVFAAHSYHGYDTTNFNEIDPSLGTRKDFADLTAAAHQLGIKIILDLVENHIADVNPWFISGIDAKSADYAKYHEWFQWSDDYSNMLTDKHPFDPTSLIWACAQYQCYHQIFGASFPELNFRNPVVRQAVKDIASYWIALGADGFRLDASKHIDQFDENAGIAVPVHGTHVWWKEFNYYVKKQAKLPVGTSTILLAGENRWDDPAQANLMYPYAGDMDSQFDFPYRSVLANLLGGKTDDSADIIKYLTQLQAAAALTANYGNTNHFFERFLSNHDLTRPATQFGAAPALLKQAATVVLTVPGLPVIYYGEEFGKQGSAVMYLPTDTYAHDEFIREPMSWFQHLTFSGDMKTSYDIDFVKTNSTAANAALMLGGGMAGVCTAPNPDYRFIKYMADGDVASWAAQKDDTTSLYAYYKQLITIRRANPLMTDPATKLATVQNTASWYEFSLSNGASSLSVIINRTAGAQTLMRAKAAKDLLSGTTAAMFTVPAYGAVILQ